MKKKNYADMDPLEEVRAIRAEINREFATAHDYFEYLWKKYPNSKPSPGFQPKGCRATKTMKRPAMRRRKASSHV
ncbi:MAG: hypothetical protein FWD61_15130 [Phycisphaerales bacterium]|nr:hypothetical protein [Phycisphaerales bacterium]